MMTNDDLSDRPEAGLRSVETQGGDERISIHEVIAEVIADAYRAGQEAMRERCAARVDRAAEEACACDGTLCGPDDVAPHDADCLAWDLDDLAQAIRALEVSHD
jgi:hypothetical protein